MNFFIKTIYLCSVGLLFVLPTLSQEKDYFPVPDSYKVEGVPPIENSEVKHLFYDPSAIRSNLIWDTDKAGRRLLVTDETNGVYLLNTPLSQPIKLFDKIIPNSVKVRPNGSGFAYTDDHEHEDNYQLYLFDFKKQASERLVKLTGKDESIDSVVWDEDGGSLFFSRVDYESKKSRICRYDFREEVCFPAEFKGVWNVIQVRAKRVLLKYSKSPSNQLLYVYDFSSNKLSPIEEIGNSRKSFIAGDRVYWTSEGDNKNCPKDPCLLSLNLKNKRISGVKLPENLLSIYDMKSSSDGSNLLIQETKEGIDYLHIFRLKKDKLVEEIPQFISGSYVIWNTRWLSDNEITYTLESIGKPASIQSYNIDSKQSTDWTKERLPVQLENKVKSPEVFKWRSFDGKEISGYAVRPQRPPQKSPVLIFIHGGPPVLDRPLFNSEDIRLAANLGLTVIHTNIRGSSGFGKEFMDADNREKRVDAIKDIQALIDWIEKQSDLDASQIYLRGGSYGGFIALATALREPHRVKGVISEYPLVSIRGYLSQSWIDEIAKNEYGDPKDENLMSQLDALSPLNNAGRWNKIPVFLTRGQMDSRVPEKDVTDLKAQLQGTGTELWYIYSTKDGHGFGGNYVFGAMYQFLEKQINKNKEK